MGDQVVFIVTHPKSSDSGIILRLGGGGGGWEEVGRFLGDHVDPRGKGRGNSQLTIFLSAK